MNAALLDVQWLEAARDAVNADADYRRLGSTDVVLGLAVGDQARLVTFEAFAVTGVRPVPAVELRDADIVLKMSPGDWSDYLEERRGGSGRSLLSLDLAERVFSARDPIARLKLARYNRSLQAFIDAGAALPG